MAMVMRPMHQASFVGLERHEMATTIFINSCAALVCAVSCLSGGATRKEQMEQEGTNEEGKLKVRQAGIGVGMGSSVECIQHPQVDARTLLPLPRAQLLVGLHLLSYHAGITSWKAAVKLLQTQLLLRQQCMFLVLLPAGTEATPAIV